jgi:polyhydroxybutyrate depolymerase
VFGAGYSSGAFQVNQMACRKAGFFKGILVFSGGAPADPQTPGAPKYANGMLECPNGGPVAAFVVHGEADQTVSPQSGDYDAQYWQYVNGCSMDRTDTQPTNCRKADNCPSSNPVVFCLVPGLDHFPWKPGAEGGWAMFQTL